MKPNIFSLVMLLGFIFYSINFGDTTLETIQKQIFFGCILIFNYLFDSTKKI